MRQASAIATAIAVSALTGSALAGPIVSKSSEKAPAPFDIVHTEILTAKGEVVFRTRVRGAAGSQKPKGTGKFEGSEVYAYVWPTSLDSGDVGFEPKQGIVALAVTFHPDFDDGAKGARNRDVWHSHWVVLTKDDACGKDALKVKDIPAGVTPKLPETWPGAPILIDSPAHKPVFTEDAVEVRIPLAKLGAIEGASYDGVTAGLRVNANLHAPLLCVAEVFDVASGDLSLPGKVE
jgi:hypothetical protein